MDTLTVGGFVPDKDLKDELRANLTASRSTSTRRAYGRCWAEFTTWCDGKTVASLPAEPFTVAMYLSDIGRKLSRSAVRQHAAAISAAHGDAGLKSPVPHQGVKKAIEGQEKRRPGRAKQARGIDEDLALEIYGAAYRPRVTRGGRMETAKQAARRAVFDIALIRTMRDAMLRRAEAAALRWGDIAGEVNGSGRLTIRVSKTDQTGAGDVKYLGIETMRALRDLRDVSTTDRVFPISDGQISKRIAQAAEAAGYDPAEFSGHSPRVGMAQDLARAGVELPKLMQAGRWRSSAMPVDYIRNEAAGRSAVAQFYGEA